MRTGHSRRNPQHCMKKQERSRASFFISQTFVTEEKCVAAALNQASGSKSMQHRGGARNRKGKTVRSLGGKHLTGVEHPWPSRPSVRSGCFLSSSPPLAHRLEAADESQGRVALRTPTCEPHSPCDPLLPGGSAGDAQPSSFKNPILAKVEIGQVESIVYFILP